MPDVDVRALEEQVLSGDRVALDRLRAWWQRRGDPGDGAAAFLFRPNQLMFRGALGPGVELLNSFRVGRLEICNLSANASNHPLEVSVWVAQDLVLLRGQATDQPPMGPGYLTPLPTYRSETFTYEEPPRV